MSYAHELHISINELVKTYTYSQLYLYGRALEILYQDDSEKKDDVDLANKSGKEYMEYLNKQGLKS